MATTWQEWGRVTRFLESARIALQRERALLTSMSFTDSSTVKIRTIEGPSTYEVALTAHATAVNDMEMLCGLILLHTYALAEAAAANALGAHVSKVGGIESWGTKLLGRNGKSWADVKDGRYGAVETAVVRNGVAHGTWTVDQRSVNRLSAAQKTHTWKVGTRFALSPAILDEHRARLKSLLRKSAAVR